MGKKGMLYQLEDVMVVVVRVHTADHSFFLVNRLHFISSSSTRLSSYLHATVSTYISYKSC